MSVMWLDFKQIMHSLIDESLNYGLKLIPGVRPSTKIENLRKLQQIFAAMPSRTYIKIGK